MLLSSGFSTDMLHAFFSNLRPFQHSLFKTVLKNCEQHNSFTLSWLTCLRLKKTHKVSDGWICFRLQVQREEGRIYDDRSIRKLVSIPEHIMKLLITPHLNPWTYYEAPHYASSQSLNTSWSSSLRLLSIPNTSCSSSLRLLSILEHIMKLLITPPLNPWTYHEAHYASSQSLNTSWSSSLRLLSILNILWRYSLRLLSIPEHIMKPLIMPPLNLWTHHEAPHYASSQSLNTSWSSSLCLLSVPEHIMNLPLHLLSIPNILWSYSLRLLSIPENIMNLPITPSLNP